MPLVHAYVNGSLDVHNLMVVCDEVIPAALNCVDDENGKLEPGCIEFFCSSVHPANGDKMNVDALISIEAYRLPEREANLDERQGAILCALEYLLPYRTFAVWLKLVTASWGSSKPDPCTPGINMSMEAALHRARRRMY